MEEDKRKNRTEDDKIGDDVEDVESSALTVKGMAFGGGVGEVKRRIGGGGGGGGDGDACCGLAKSLRAKEIGSVPTMLSEKYVLQVIWKVIQSGTEI
ncbi:hypothetical protein HZH66_007020 [Vespula vulgaris]|uniref:Uncharacterized protein n=1 Tax=Vespula vulgaris TaxID=7454 RepID=A0A834JWW0_VESVU|nr:hypothetical protein HZH66_007020 [Vespula vulgaris]